MDRKRYKTHPRREAALAGVDTWQLESLESADARFLELEPFLYCADAALCQLARTVAFTEGHTSDQSAAVVFPPRDGVGWLQGFLSEYYEVTVCSATAEPLLEEVTSRFDAVAVYGAPPQYLLGNSHFVIDCDTSWADEEELFARLWHADELLHEEGAYACVLPAQLHESGPALVTWSDGLTTPLEELLKRPAGPLRTPLQASEIPFANLHVAGDAYLTAFLRRHRAFFGRGVRGACLARMSDPDFHDTVKGPGSHLRCSVVLVLSQRTFFARPAADPA